MEQTQLIYKTRNNGRSHPPALPSKAVKLAQRAVQLAATGSHEQRGRHTIELLITKDGRWLIIVDDGRPEDLGES